MIMRSVMMTTAIAASLLASGCDRSASAKAAFEPASEKECAVMMVVARDKLNLHKYGPNWLNGMNRKDWRPTCDWAARGVKLNIVGRGGNFGTVAGGDEITFHRPEFGPEGAKVVVEMIDYGGHETLTTCKVSGYDRSWSLYSCKENDIMPF
jgi:hypothetical protein